MATRIMTEMQTVSDVFRQFIPSQAGESLAEQIYPWNTSGIQEDMQKPLPMHEGDPNTMLNIMSMMAVEMQHWVDYHAYSKMTSDSDLKKLYTELARAEHVHHLKLMSFLSKPHHPAESVLLMEMAVLSAYNMAMQTDPNDTAKSAYRHIFMDHLQHAGFAADKVGSMGCPVDKMTGGSDLSGGRDLNQQFMKADDTIWKGSFKGAYMKDSVSPQTLVNIDMLIAGENAAWNGYHSAFENTEEMDIKTNWADFQSIEDQHLAILGSLIDPSETILERSLVHEQVEILQYKMLMDSESNDEVKEVFSDLYREDMEQARLLGQLAK